jgi:hypothetical protein
MKRHRPERTEGKLCLASKMNHPLSHMKQRVAEIICSSMGRPLQVFICFSSIVILSGCARSDAKTDSSSPLSESTIPANNWPDGTRFRELMAAGQVVAHRYNQKAMTYDELTAEISRIATEVGTLTSSPSPQCNTQMGKYQLEINQLRVALINRIESDIKDAWKVLNLSHYITYGVLCP